MKQANIKHTVYPLEPVMHAGKAYVPGESMECDPDETAAILQAGRGTMDLDAAKAAEKIYKTQQQAAAERETRAL